MFVFLEAVSFVFSPLDPDLYWICQKCFVSPAESAGVAHITGVAASEELKDGGKTNPCSLSVFTAARNQGEKQGYSTRRWAQIEGVNNATVRENHSEYALKSLPGASPWID